MLSTLINLGTQLSENRGEWDDIIDYPHVDKDLKNGVSLFVAPIIFDLDRKDVYFGHLKEYDGVNSCLQYKYIKTLTGSGKATYACVEAGKLEQLRKTFFGKVNTKGNPPESGQFQEAIQKDFPSFKNTPLGRLLPEIFSLRRIFEKKMCLVTEVKGKRESLIDEKKVMSNIKGLTSNSRIVLYYTSVV